ncbi:MAG: hypothetical protein K2W97_00010 [Chthoniobacterales bacterium]|nr:hypothetical protein [Chthoniobacterales bacterium]
MRKTKLLFLLVVLLQSTRLLVAQDNSAALKTSCETDLSATWCIDNNSTQNIGQLEQPGDLDNKTISSSLVSNDVSLLESDESSEAHITTVDDYGAFLNAVATTTDVHELYHSRTANQLMKKAKEDGHWNFFAVDEEEDKPMLGLTKLDAMRFCNWVENRCLTRKDAGEKAITSTEVGSYELRGDEVVSTNSKARYHLAKNEENQNGETIFAITTQPDDVMPFQISPLMMLGREGLVKNKGKGDKDTNKWHNSSYPHYEHEDDSENRSSLASRGDLSQGDGIAEREEHNSNSNAVLKLENLRNFIANPLQNSERGNIGISLRKIIIAVVIAANMIIGGHAAPEPLRLEDFRRAAIDHPIATRFIIREEENRNFIQPQEAVVDDSSNRQENIKITAALRKALESEYSEQVVERLFPSSISSYEFITSLDAKKLNDIFEGHCEKFEKLEKKDEELSKMERAIYEFAIADRQETDMICKAQHWGNRFGETTIPVLGVTLKEYSDPIQDSYKEWDLSNIADRTRKIAEALKPPVSKLVEGSNDIFGNPLDSAWNNWANPVVERDLTTLFTKLHNLRSPKLVAQIDTQGRKDPCWATTIAASAWRERMRQSEELLKELKEEGNAKGKSDKKIFFESMDFKTAEVQVEADRAAWMAVGLGRIAQEIQNKAQVVGKTEIQPNFTIVESSCAPVSVTWSQFNEIVQSLNSETAPEDIDIFSKFRKMESIIPVLKRLISNLNACSQAMEVQQYRYRNYPLPIDCNADELTSDAIKVAKEANKIACAIVEPIIMPIPRPDVTINSFLGGLVCAPLHPVLIIPCGMASGVGVDIMYTNMENAGKFFLPIIANTTKKLTEITELASLICRPEEASLSAHIAQEIVRIAKEISEVEELSKVDLVMAYNKTQDEYRKAIEQMKKDADTYIFCESNNMMWEENSETYISCENEVLWENQRKKLAANLVRLNLECKLQEMEAKLSGNKELAQGYFQIQQKLEQATKKISQPLSFWTTIYNVVNEASLFQSEGITQKYRLQAAEAIKAGKSELANGYQQAAETSKHASELFKSAVVLESRFNLKTAISDKLKGESWQKKADYQAKMAEATEIGKSKLAEGYRKAVMILEQQLAWQPSFGQSFYAEDIQLSIKFLQQQANYQVKAAEASEAGIIRLAEGYQEAVEILKESAELFKKSILVENTLLTSSRLLYQKSGGSLEKKAYYHVKEVEAAEAGKSKLANGYQQAAGTSERASKMFKKAAILISTWKLPNEKEMYSYSGEHLQKKADYQAKEAEAIEAREE